MDVESGYGLKLMNALTHLHKLPSQKHSVLLPKELCDVMKDNYVCPQDDFQRKLDHILAEAHDDHDDMVNNKTKLQ